MTFRVSVMLYCDGPKDLRTDCDDTPFHSYVGTPETKGEAWAEARDLGWERIGGRHYCMHCAAEAKRARKAAKRAAQAKEGAE